MTMGAFEDDIFSSPEERRAYEEFCAAQERAEEFRLDRPALVCRWRMAGRRVPLLNRHIRALAQRTVNGSPLPTGVLSWAKQHVEWSLAEGDYPDPDGVLMLVIDVNGNAAMTVGAYEPLADTSREALRARAADAHGEQAGTGLRGPCPPARHGPPRPVPELLCAVLDGTLYLGAGEGESLCGAATLVEQLASTEGHRVVRAGADAVRDAAGAVLLVSDEHGVVPASELASVDGGDAGFVRSVAQGVSARS